jgi:two-component system cell cycle sensor histidine kinase/response regulator CckA
MTTPSSQTRNERPGDPANAGVVFVVDDDPLIRSIVARVLSRAGRTARTYSDAEAALAALTTCGDSPELVITDVSMPGELDGIALAARVSERLPGVPIVLMSGDSASLARVGRATGVTATLAKPFSLEQLGEALGLAGHGSR